MKETEAKKTGRPTMMTTNAKTRTRIGCWNVKTLLEASRLSQANLIFNEYNLKILGLSEVRWLESGEHLLNDGNLFIFSGKPEGQHHMNGVGLLINKDIKSSLLRWTPVNDRILIAKFHSKIRPVNIIQCYAPTEVATVEEKDNFYENLNTVISECREGDINILMGDLNAKVGDDNTGYEQTMGKHGLGIINDNGHRLVEFCTDRNLLIGGTLFPHKNCHKTTWTSPDGNHKNQIDHICFNRKWRRSVEDVRNKRGADISSDHYLVVAEIKLKIANLRNKYQATQKKFNINKLSLPRVRNRFQEELKYKHERNTYSDTDTIDVKWGMIKDIYKSTSENVLGFKHKHRKEWISETTWELIEKRKQIHNQKLVASDTTQKERLTNEYRDLNKQVKRSARRDKRTWINNLAKQAETAAVSHDTRTLYSISRKLSTRKPTTNNPILDEHKKLQSSVTAQVKVWENHFKHILDNNHTEETDDLNPWPRITPARIRFCIEPPTKAEVKRAIQKLKCNKSPGPDNINAELLQVCSDTSANILLPLLRDIWEKETVPKEWKEGLIIKLFKKGNKHDCNNYRGITLLNICSKILSLILLDRLQDSIEPYIRGEQAGFRPSRSCIDQINTLRIILEQASEWRSPIYLLFIDFEKAFDKINRNIIWKILATNGIPDKIINIIKNMYEGSTCRVVHQGRVSDPIPVRAGVKQGCVLSPLLFLISIDTVMRATNTQPRGIQWGLTTRLEDLDYADDLCLLSHTLTDLQTKLRALDLQANKVGLKINLKKTKEMRVNTANAEPLHLQDKDLEKTETFCYLGSIVTQQGGAESDILNRIQKARQAFANLSKFWLSANISKKTKIRVFNSNIKSVLLYACETWLVTEKLTHSLQTFVNKCLRRIIGIRWPDTISNRQLWELTGQKEIKLEIRARKWRWVGHTLRRDPHNIAKQSFQWNPQGKRRVGRPKMTWRRSIDLEAQEAGKSWGEIRALAQNRTRWRCFVDALCSSQEL